MPVLLCAGAGRGGVAGQQLSISRRDIRCAKSVPQFEDERKKGARGSKEKNTKPTPRCPARRAKTWRSRPGASAHNGWSNGLRRPSGSARRSSRRRWTRKRTRSCWSRSSTPMGASTCFATIRSGRYLSTPWPTRRIRKPTGARPRWAPSRSCSHAGRRGRAARQGRLFHPHDSGGRRHHGRGGRLGVVR